MVAATLTLGSAGRVEASPDAPPFMSSGKQPAPEELRAQGDAAARAGRTKEALGAWYASWDGQPSAGLACSIGGAELVSQNYPAAATFLRRCVLMKKEKVSTNTLDRRTLESDRFDLARKHVAEVIIETEPGATVTVSNSAEPLGTAPLPEPIFLNPGFYRIDAQNDERSGAVTLNALPGQQHHIAVALTRAPLLPTRSTELVVSTPKPATTPKPPHRFVWWPVALGGGMSVTAASLGIVFRVLRDDAEDEEAAMFARILSEQKPAGLGCGRASYHEDCDLLRDMDAKRAAFGSVSTGSFVALGVLAAATIGYAAYEKDRVSLMPTMGGVMGRYSW